MSIYPTNDFRDYLEHHGVIGQKWGVKNGPPYPLKNSLSNFDKEAVTQNTIKKYSSQYKQLSHIRVNSNTKGTMFTDKGKLVAMVNTEKKNDGNWIQALEVFGDNKGKGYSKDLLRHAVNDLGATKLSVNKKNKLAKKIYDDFGFETFRDDSTMYYMELKKKG